jgi:hypothetical protein
MKWSLVCLLLSISFSSLGEVTPEDVESMLQQMVRENVISAEEAQKAKIRMKSMTPEQWGQINDKAAKVASRMPASASPSQNRIEEVHGLDLEGAQFKTIQSEIKKILPEPKD